MTKYYQYYCEYPELLSNVDEINDKYYGKKCTIFIKYRCNNNIKHEQKIYNYLNGYICNCKKIRKIMSYPELFEMIPDILEILSNKPIIKYICLCEEERFISIYDLIKGTLCSCCFMRVNGIQVNDLMYYSELISDIHEELSYVVLSFEKIITFSINMMCNICKRKWKTNRYNLVTGRHCQECNFKSIDKK